MQYQKNDSVYFVRIDRGEEILSQLKKVCVENQIELGLISGIGAVNQATIGFFDVQNKLYHFHPISSDHEITSLSGNITTMNGEIYLHCHITLADENQKVFGGHLNEAFVSATCEVVIRQFAGKVVRHRDEKLSLNLLAMEE